MKITNEHCQQFVLLLKKDGIENNIFNRLHEVCDPNQYMIDVLKIDVNQETMPIYNRFATELDKYFLFRNKLMGNSYYYPPNKMLPSLVVNHAFYRPSIEEFEIILSIYYSCTDFNCAKKAMVDIRRDNHTFNNYVVYGDSKIWFQNNKGKTDRIWLYHRRLDGQQSAKPFGWILFHF